MKTPPYITQNLKTRADRKLDPDWVEYIPPPQACEDCDVPVVNRTVTVRLVDHPAAYTRRACATCGLLYNAESGRYDIEKGNYYKQYYAVVRSNK